jgi:hypothetical protein
MTSDISVVRVTGTGSAGVGPARIRAVNVLVGAGAGRLTVTDGSGGPTRLDIDLAASTSHYIELPDHGARCQTGIQVTAATNVTAATFFYS